MVHTFLLRLRYKSVMTKKHPLFFGLFFSGDSVHLSEILSRNDSQTTISVMANLSSEFQMCMFIIVDANNSG